MEVRNWTEFFESRNFSFPDTTDILLDRFQSNLQYYIANYAILVAAFVFIFSLSKPFLLFFVVSWVSICLIVNAQSFPQNTSNILIGAASIVHLIACGYVSGPGLTFLLFILSILIFVHAIFKTNKLKTKLSNFSANLKENLSGITKDIGSDFQSGMDELLANPAGFFGFGKK
eukprot:TRINITY_DN11323_c0_g1_i1.p1 TRINITY_DN11323_c0_g1~~TRINITY_DN11323_c0_g1_i1.p1  ORF type:complete len:173 (-),score=68.18 TRINITY_DN11323_c0_g1_i1:61-579(-)